jgi:hypothetical protein
MTTKHNAVRRAAGFLIILLVARKPALAGSVFSSADVFFNGSEVGAVGTVTSDGRLYVEASPMAQMLNLTVKDTGPGLVVANSTSSPGRARRYLEPFSAFTRFWMTHSIQALKELARTAWPTSR